MQKIFSSRLQAHEINARWEALRRFLGEQAAIAAAEEAAREARRQKSTRATRRAHLQRAA